MSKPKIDISPKALYARIIDLGVELTALQRAIEKRGGITEAEVSAAREEVRREFAEGAAHQILGWLPSPAHKKGPVN